MARIAPSRRLAKYKPHPHQAEFHANKAKYRAIVSGIGSGKTRLGVEEILKWTQLYPGSLGVVGRLTAKSLRETTQRRFFECCDPKLIQSFNSSEGHVWIKTGCVDEDGLPVYSEILFMHLDEPGPLGSLDISYFWIDEAHEPDGQEVPEQTFDMLQARLRHPIGPHRGFVTTNPGGKDWIWKKFFNPNNRDTFHDHVGWNVPTSVNEKYLPVGYVDELKRTHSEAWVQRFIYGSFDAFEGQVFPDFDDKFHVKRPHELDIPSSWKHGAGFDFGVSAPTACIYGAVNKDGQIVIYGEDYQAEADVEDFAKRIKSRGFSSVFADPSVINRGVGKMSPKQLYQESGVYLIQASNDEDFFLSFFTQLLREKMPDGSPKFIISSNCSHLIDQIKSAAWDSSTITGTTHDKMKRMENHALDAFKYFLNTLGFKPQLLDPIKPVRPSAKKGDVTVNGVWIHESFLEDSDFNKEDYANKTIKDIYMEKYL